MRTSNVYTPSHFVFLHKKQGTWFLLGSKPLLNLSEQPVPPPKLRIEQHGLTPHQLTIECFRRFMGRDGYYMIDLKRQYYYYCGQKGDSIKQTVRSLGIYSNFNGQ